MALVARVAPGPPCSFSAMDDLDGPVRRALHDARLELSLESQRGPDGTKRGLLAAAGIVLPGAVPGVPEADLLDAAAGGWTAAPYAEGRAQPFPPGHAERLGAIWR
jgi:hypothetical protein